MTNNFDLKMNTLSRKIGYWSSILMLISLVVWIVCFVTIAATTPMFVWSNFNDYFAYVNSNSQFFQNLAKIFVLLFGFFYLMLINSFYDCSEESKKPAARLSLLFALGFTILSGINYFIQISAVRLNLEKGAGVGLEMFLQANPLSVMNSIALLGWTLFLGFSSLFIIPAVAKIKALKIYFIINTISCFLASIGYLFQIDIITFFFVNIGVGGALLLISIASIKYFKSI